MDIIRLDIGSPDLPPHQRVIEALARSAQRGAHHGYQPHKGIPRFREAWAAARVTGDGVEEFTDKFQEVLVIT